MSFDYPNLGAEAPYNQNFAPENIDPWGTGEPPSRQSSVDPTPSSFVHDPQQEIYHFFEQKIQQRCCRIASYSRNLDARADSTSPTSTSRGD